MQNLMSIAITLLSVLSWPFLGWAQEVRAPYVGLKSVFFERLNPKAEEWNQTPEQVITMFPQNITQPSLMKPTVNQIRVKAVHNNKWLAVHLEWEDKTKDTHLARLRLKISLPKSQAINPPSLLY